MSLLFKFYASLSAYLFEFKVKRHKCKLKTYSYTKKNMFTIIL